MKSDSRNHLGMPTPFRARSSVSGIAETGHASSRPDRIGDLDGNQLRELGGLALLLRLVPSALGWLIAIAAALLVFAWLIGRIASDRFAWSQWLLWIPTPLTLAASLLGLLAAFRPARRARRKRSRIMRWVTTVVGLMIYFISVEHRLMHTAPAVIRNVRTIRLSHWNMTVRAANPQQAIKEMIDLDGDITVLTGAGYLSWEKPVVDKLNGGAQPQRLGTMDVLSRFPITKATPLIATDLIYVFEVTIDTTSAFGRPIVLYAVDLPSNPKISRMAQARRVRRILNELRNSGSVSQPVLPPDIVVGDFNTTRDSAAMRVMFPDLRDAYNEAGHGYGASFPREWPLYHIDHILLTENLRGLRYDIIDQGISRHRAQAVFLTVR